MLTVNWHGVVRHLLMDVTESGCMMAGLQFDGLVAMLKHFVETPIPPQDGVDTEPLMLAEAVSRDEETREEMLAERQAEVTAARAASRRVDYLVTGKHHRPPTKPKPTRTKERCGNALSSAVSRHTRGDSMLLLLLLLLLHDAPYRAHVSARSRLPRREDTALLLPLTRTPTLMTSSYHK